MMITNGSSRTAGSKGTRKGETAGDVYTENGKRDFNLYWLETGFDPDFSTLTEN